MGNNAIYMRDVYSLERDLDAYGEIDDGTGNVGRRVATKAFGIFGDLVFKKPLYYLIYAARRKSALEGRDWINLK